VFNIQHLTNFSVTGRVNLVNRYKKKLKGMAEQHKISEGAF